MLKTGQIAFTYKFITRAIAILLFYKQTASKINIAYKMLKLTQAHYLTKYEC